MNPFRFFGAVLVVLGAGSFAYANPCPEGNCEPKTKEECFNLVCHYKNKREHGGFERCRAAATFVKDVTLDGGEVRDDSNKRNHPSFEVVCDSTPIYNNGAYRFTDLLGTRIQAQTGPHPAITLPRGALHSGTDGTSGDHISPSILEVDTENGVDRLHGQCYIWTGNP